MKYIIKSLLSFMKIYRLFIILLFLISISSLLNGCTEEEDNKLTITLSLFKGSNYLEAFRKKFPEIDFVVEEYAGANMSDYILQQIERGEASDLIFYSTFLNAPWVKDKFVDLSGKRFLSKYDRGILKTLNIDNCIYQIPGPVVCRYFVVNKTLFEENGWEIPMNFDEIISACELINKSELDIIPIGLGIAGAGYPFSLISGHSQCGFMSTDEGKSLEEAYLRGEASIGEIFGEGLDMGSRLIEAGAFEPEYFKNVWNVSAKDLGNRKVAMAYMLATQEDNNNLFCGDIPDNATDVYGEYKDEYTLLPFFGKKAGDKGLILGTSSMWAVNKRLEEKGCEKKLANAIKVMDWIATEEGQLAIRENSSMIPALHGLSTDDVAGYMKDFWNANADLPKAFFLYTGYEDIIVEATKAFTDAMFENDSTSLKNDFVKIADEIHNETVMHLDSTYSFGYIPHTLSIKESRKLCCESLKYMAEADFAFASECGQGKENKNQTGFAGKIFSGTISESKLNIVLGFLKSTISKATLTGKELFDILSTGKVMKNSRNIEDAFIYWTSKAIIKKEKGVVKEITINGKTYKEDDLITVAIITGDLPYDYPDNKFIDTDIKVIDALKEYVSLLYKK